MAHPVIRTIYLYLFALVGLAMVTVGGARLVDLGLKLTVFRQADSYYVMRSVPQPITKDGQTVTETEEERDRRVAEEQRQEEQSRRANQERQASSSIATIVVGLPLWLYHWKVIQRQRQENG
jgi:hypothetical protein